jgi:hypothetical protein
MAFIRKRTPEIGDWVITKRTHTNSAGTMDVGTEVKVIGVGIRGYDIEDDEGNVVCEIGWEI